MYLGVASETSTVFQSITSVPRGTVGIDGSHSIRELPENEPKKD
jgi:hypothetical protein